MKIGQLVKILQTANPNDEVSLSLGEDIRYRAKCAKAELEECECLGCLSLEKVEIGQEYNGETYYELILKDNYDESCLDKVTQEFDKKYPEYKFG